jgi:hypothetical protein
MVLRHSVVIDLPLLLWSRLMHRVSAGHVARAEGTALDVALRAHSRAFATPLVAIAALVAAGFAAACFGPL